MSAAATQPTTSRLILAWPDRIQEIHQLLKTHPGIRRIYLFGLQYPDHPIVTPINTLSQLEQHFLADADYFAEGRVNVHFGPEKLKTQFSTCQELQEKLLHFTQQQLSCVALRATRGWHILANEIANLSQISHSIAPLQQCWAADPVIIVGAGPSLDETAPLLHTFRSRARIIACDGAWHTLAKHHIRPDLIVTADDSHKVWRYFDQLPPEQSHVSIVAMLQSCCHIARHHQGRLYFARNGRQRDQQLTDQFKLPLPILNAGLCVGHMALEIACWTGASQLIMTGFDLGFKNGAFHPADQPNPYFHNEPPPAENCLPVPANEGGTIQTELSMNFYRQEFEQRIARLPQTVINATAGGAKIEGTIYQSLQDTLQPLPQCPQKPLPTANGSFPPVLPTLAQQTPDQLRPLIEEALNPALRTAVRLLKEDVQHHLPGAASQLAAAQPQLTDQIETYAALIQTLAQLAWPRPKTNRALNFASFNPNLPELTLIPHYLDPNDLPALWHAIHVDEIDTLLFENGNFLPAAWSLPGLRAINLITNAHAEIMTEHHVPGYEEIQLT